MEKLSVSLREEINKKPTNTELIDKNKISVSENHIW